MTTQVYCNPPKLTALEFIGIQGRIQDLRKGCAYGDYLPRAKRMRNFFATTPTN